ncbi:ABC-F family ATP-binding cassette domain-containing protein [Bordetella trematum]|uniref:ABC-F family ATP-binding cassette domain-containing protein n=1 Tax=Bordetella trematum TaxID=123899 RepID=UPI0013FDF84C|nr:ABC-F family ATP-binding cassette domain-containing protein [Bordetella trematum]
MTNPFLTLEGVSCVLPDGRTLFSDLNEHFDLRPTGLVGRNGAGKSVLARMLAGLLQPSAGRCLRSGKVFYLAQQVAPGPQATVAALAGLQAPLAALARIAAGSSDPADFDCLDERWDLAQQLTQALQRSGLGHLDATTPAARLSGGEAMRVSLLAAEMSGADFLVLDEPSNHLDASARGALIEHLQAWRGGLLVVSHDRQLLQAMTRIVALSSLGLRSYGGDFSFYEACRQQEREDALAGLAQRKQERRRQEQALREQQERQARRQARGHRHGQQANQASILLDRQKERSQASAGKLQQRQAAAREQLTQRVHAAAQRIADEAEIVLHALPVAAFVPRQVAALEQAVLPGVRGATRCIDLALHGPQRIGVSGPNGCGKSTLLRVLAGRQALLQGRSQRWVPGLYLDQRLESLAPHLSVLAQLQSANPKASQSDVRQWLAHLGLDAQQIQAPSGMLSGGERLKAALACVLYADPPPQWLLLDEPSNHLDLASLEALEALLRHYPGALMVVSHDETFLDRLALTHRLRADEAGWRLLPC